MKRRGFLKLLALLPFAPALAEAAAAKTIYPERIMSLDKALNGCSDQTSIWLINWAPPRGRMHNHPQITYSMWRDSLQGHSIPVYVTDELKITEGEVR